VDASGRDALIGRTKGAGDLNTCREGRVCPGVKGRGEEKNQAPRQRKKNCRRDQKKKEGHAVITPRTEYSFLVGRGGGPRRFKRKREGTHASIGKGGGGGP